LILLEIFLKIAICIITYRRPEGLSRALEKLNHLEFDDEPPEIEIVVVDNDREGSAEAVCASVESALRYPLTLVIEPRQGIPFARNRALEIVSGRADWIAFLDDDEEPSPRWCAELIRVQREYEADIVAGPVLPAFEQPPPKWMEIGPFFHRKRYATGHQLPLCYTGNVLFPSTICDETGIRFDTRLSQIGGSDRHFFQRLAMAGYKIIWADEAIVYEWIPPSRATAGWINRRFFATGNVGSIIDLDLRPSLKIVLKLFLKGWYWIVRGTLTSLLGLVGGKRFLIRGVSLIHYGAGVLVGMIGFRFKRYSRAGH
jgi:glycosyltransferase involved in cell wall biosynthesis